MSPDDIPPTPHDGPDSQNEDERAATAMLLSRMDVNEKLAAALKGTREMRLLLVCDPNRLVALAVLDSPKLSESEVEQIARMGRVSEDVLRTIGQSRSWTKHYPIVLALVRNAKTPLAVSMQLLQRLTARDVKIVSMDRNVPDPLRIAARRRLGNAQA